MSSCHISLVPRSEEGHTAPQPQGAKRVKTATCCPSLGIEQREPVCVWACSVCVSPVLGPGHGELMAGCKTGMAVVVTVCGFSRSKREDKWLRRGNELQVGKSYFGGAKARLGFEGRVRVCQVNKECG